MAEAIVGQPESLGQHPALPVVQRQKRLDTLLAVAAGLADLLLQIREGNQREDRMAKLGFSAAVHPPEPNCVRHVAMFSAKVRERSIAIRENVT